MKISNLPLFNFYNQKHLTEISKKGYYPEKINFITTRLKKLSLSKNLQIIDVACNDGTLTKIYSKYGDVCGVDINKRSVTTCRKKGIVCIHSDIDSLPVKYQNKFDVVVATDIIEHVFDTDKFLINLKKLLRPSGTLLLTTANVASIGRRTMMLFGKNPYLEYSTKYPNVEINVGHIRYYTVKDMEIQLSGLGFKDIHIYGDKINITSTISIPHVIAKWLPTISRYMFVECRI